MWLLNFYKWASNIGTNKHDVCRGKNCIKRFFKSLQEHTVEIINFAKEKIDDINKLTAGII